MICSVTIHLEIHTQSPSLSWGTLHILLVSIIWYDCHILWVYVQCKLWFSKRMTFFYLSLEMHPQISCKEHTYSMVLLNTSPITPQVKRIHSVGILSNSLMIFPFNCKARNENYQSVWTYYFHFHFIISSLTSKIIYV